jgi:hypothetical protein
MDLLPQVEGIVEKITRTVETWLAAQKGWSAGQDLRTLARECRDLGLAVGHTVFATLIDRYGDGRQGARVRGGCGGTRRWRGTRRRTVHDLMNRDVTLRRAYYFCDDCGQGGLPLDEQLGLPAAHVTPAR